MFKWVLGGLLLLPLAEIYVLIEVGSVIGAGWTLFLLIAATVAGAWLVRLHGMMTLHRARASIARGDIPAEEMLAGLALFISGFLLLTPGFITDLLGVLLFIPAVRRALLLKLTRNSNVLFRQQRWSAHRGYSTSDDVIEGEIVSSDYPQQLR